MVFLPVALYGTAQAGVKWIFGAQFWKFSFFIYFYFWLFVNSAERGKALFFGGWCEGRMLEKAP